MHFCKIEFLPSTVKSSLFYDIIIRFSPVGIAALHDDLVDDVPELFLL
jgi:hypothetical protein